MIKIPMFLCGLTLSCLAWGDVVLPREPASIPEGKTFFGWNTKADGSGIWAEHLGRCERCGALFRLWGSPDDFYGSCTNNATCSEECPGWSSEFYAFHETRATNYYPIFVDERYSWSMVPGGVRISYLDDGMISSFSVDKLGGCPVFGISSYAFEGCTNLSAVKIADSVSSIARDAFFGVYLGMRQELGGYFRVLSPPDAA